MEPHAHAELMAKQCQFFTESKKYKQHQINSNDTSIVDCLFVDPFLGSML